MCYVKEKSAESEIFLQDTLDKVWILWYNQIPFPLRGDEGTPRLFYGVQSTENKPKRF